MTKQDKHVSSLDFMRALAALSVCWYHFVYYTPDFLTEGSWIKQSGKYGFLGVEVFFVISGFILPWSMYHSAYRIHNYFKFLGKRVIRIEPPYIITIILTLALNYFSSLSSFYRGSPFVLSWPQILLHLGYLNVFFDYKWLNASFWTLAIEFQYYLLIGLLFPLIVSKNKFLRFGVFILFLLSFLFNKSGAFITAYGPLFLIGIITFLYKSGQIKLLEYLITFFSCLFVTYFFLDPVYVFVGLLSVGLILFVKIKNKAIIFLGSISYSLYLLHPIIGQKIINLSQNFVHNEWLKMGVVFIAIGISILASYLLYRLIEAPSQRISKNIKFQNTQS